MNNLWIKLTESPGNMPDCDCWVTDGKIVFFSPEGEFIPLNNYTHYMVAEKPQPPTESNPDLFQMMGISDKPVNQELKELFESFNPNL